MDLNQLGSNKDFFVMIWVFGNGVAVIESGAKQMRKETWQFWRGKVMQRTLNFATAYGSDTIV